MHNFRPRHDTFVGADDATALLLRISYFLYLNCFSCCRNFARKRCGGAGGRPSPMIIATTYMCIRSHTA